MAMTVDEAKERKLEIEKEVTQLFKDFEAESGFRVGYLDVMRKRPKKSKHNDPESVMPDEPYRSEDIETVNIDLRME